MEHVVTDLQPRLDRRAAELEAPESIIARLHARAERAEEAQRLLQVDLDNANIDLIVKRRTITELRKQLEQRAVTGDFAAEIEEAFTYWQNRCWHPKSKLGIKRAQNVKARMLAGHTLDEVRQAIDGAALDPYIVGGKRFDDLELVCRDEPQFDSFMGRRKPAILSKPLRLILRVFCLPDGVKEPTFDTQEQAYRYRCPVCRSEDERLPFLASPRFIFCEARCLPSDMTVANVREALLSAHAGGAR